MTTIVITEEEVAWDTQYNVGNIRMNAPDLPKVVVKGAKIYASAGDADAGEKLPDWERAGADPDTAPSGAWDLAVISLFRGKPRLRIYSRDAGEARPSNLGHWLPFPAAMGTGGDFALGALKLAQIRKLQITAAQAAYVGSLIDINSGGEIQSLNILDTLNRAKRRRA